MSGATEPRMAFKKVATRANTVHLSVFPMRDTDSDREPMRGPRATRPQGIVAHFALHAAGRLPLTTGHDALVEDLLQHRLMKGGVVLRGE
jgi:hypothetical protein